MPLYCYFIKSATLFFPKNQFYLSHLKFSLKQTDSPTDTKYAAPGFSFPVSLWQIWPLLFADFSAAVVLILYAWLFYLLFAVFPFRYICSRACVAARACYGVRWLLVSMHLPSRQHKLLLLFSEHKMLLCQ